MSDRPLSESDLQTLRETSFLRSVRYFSEIGSTNTQAVRLLSNKQPIETPSLVYAESQTAGRGRGANLWWSRSGSLTFSVIIDMRDYGLSPDQQIKLPLLTGLAVLRSCDSQLGSSTACSNTFALKWPNDVFLTERKLAGILIEVPSIKPDSTDQSSAQHAVIGVGLNVNNSWTDAPEDLKATGVSLLDHTGSTFDRLQILNEFLNHLEQLIRSLSEGRSILRDWSNHCMLTGKRVTMIVGDDLVTGDCLGLAENGALFIRTPQGTREFLGGVVKSWE